MVRIINGEIVQDDDPRLRQRNQAPATTGATPTSSAAAGSRMGSLLGQQPPLGGQPPRPSTQNPLDYVANILKIENSVVTIPAIDFYQLKLSATRIPLVNFIPIGLLIVIFGLRGVAFSLALFLLYKHSDNANVPP